MIGKIRQVRDATAKQWAVFYRCDKNALCDMEKGHDSPCETSAAYWKSRAETAELKVLCFHEEIIKVASSVKAVINESAILEKLRG